MLIISDIISTDEDPGHRNIRNIRPNISMIKPCIIKICGVSTKYKLYFFAMQTYKELIKLFHLIKINIYGYVYVYKNKFITLPFLPTVL